MENLTPFISALVSGLLVFILGILLKRLEEKRKGSSAVAVKELDNAARLLEDLLKERRDYIDENRMLNTRLLEEIVKRLEAEAAHKKI